MLMQTDEMQQDAIECGMLCHRTLMTAQSAMEKFNIEKVCLNEISHLRTLPRM